MGLFGKKNRVAPGGDSQSQKGKKQKNKLILEQENEEKQQLSQNSDEAQLKEERQDVKQGKSKREKKRWKKLLCMGGSDVVEDARDRQMELFMRDLEETRNRLNEDKLWLQGRMANVAKQEEGLIGLKADLAKQQEELIGDKADVAKQQEGLIEWEHKVEGREKAVRKAERRAQKKNTMQDQATQATVTTKEQYVQAENKIAVPNIARGSLLPPLVLPEPCKKITQKPAVEVTTSEVAIAKTKKIPSEKHASQPNMDKVKETINAPQINKDNNQLYARIKEMVLSLQNITKQIKTVISASNIAPRPQRNPNLAYDFDLEVIRVKSDMILCYTRAMMKLYGAVSPMCEDIQEENVYDRLDDFLEKMYSKTEDITYTSDAITRKDCADRASRMDKIDDDSDLIIAAADRIYQLLEPVQY